jgi:hypothetical protein
MTTNALRLPRVETGAWGSYECRVGGHGMVTEHLQVLPPDTTSRDRALWALLTIWPGVGFLLGIAAAVAAHQLTGTDTSAAVGAVVWLLPWVLMEWRGRRFIRRVHESWRIHDLASWEPALSPLRDDARRLRAADPGPLWAEGGPTWSEVYARTPSRARRG